MPITRKIIIALSILLLFSHFSFSASIEKLGLKDGLSNNYINCITQDSDGFLWFATEWGLSRFDGDSFVNYVNNPENEKTISGNALNKIIADNEENCIWIATQRNGLSAFDKTTQTFINYPLGGDAPNAVRANGITSLYLGNDRTLWIGTYNNGFKKLDKKTNVITHYNSSNLPGLKSNRMWAITVDADENIYLGHVSEGLSIISLKDNSIKHFTHDPNNPQSLPSNTIEQIYIDSRQNIWLATTKGLSLYHPEKEIFNTFYRERNNSVGYIGEGVTCISEINNELWIGTYNGGINILDLKNFSLKCPKPTFRNIFANDLDDGLSNPRVRSLLQDSFGNIWIGTSGGGINFIRHREPYFNTFAYSSIKGYENGLSHKTAWGLCCDNENRLWVGTQGGGIDVYQAEKKVGHYNKDENNLPENIYISALYDTNGTIWFGGDAKGIVVYNKNTRNFDRFKFSIETNSEIQIRTIFEDNAKNIWFGGNSNIFKYNLISKQTTIFSGNLIRSISQDKNGNMWIGTLIHGLSIVTPDFKQIHHFNTQNKFPSNGINHIMRDSNGGMWVATMDGLVYFDDVDELHYKILNKSTGLSDNFVRAAIEGKPGEIWFSTNSGICRYTVKNGKVENYDHYDNVPWGVFMSGSVAKSNDGVIYFGSQDGVCYFNSNETPGNIVVPNVKITGFDVYKPQNLDSENDIVNIPVSPEIHLKHNQNTFSIFFNVMDYSLKDMVNYSYSLKGLNDAWYQTKGDNYVTFRNVPPGKYSFLVRATVRNQNLSNEVTTLTIVISPPFWFSWWAKTIYAIAILLITFFIIRFYKRKLSLENQLYWEKENHKKEQDLNDEKFRFYTNIAHELRTPLTLILGPLEDLSEDKRLESDQTKKVSLIHKSASRLSNLTNQILEFRKSETNNRKLSVIRGDISPLLHEIWLKYKELNQNKAVSLSVSIESEQTTLFYDEEVLTIILDNLISNALKYTFEGSVSIIFRHVSINDTSFAEIEVKDTGFGIPEESLDKIFDRYYQVKGEYQAFGTGIGLSLVKNMVQLHEATIEVKSKENEGASFYVRLLQNNEYPQAIHLKDKEVTKTVQNTTGTKPLLLIVEDNSDIREYVAHTFIEDFDILTAENGEMGIELAFEKLPDIIISDVMMPIMDGMQLTKTLKEDMRTSHIPIILLTAKDSDQDKTEGYSIGADSYITKPFSAKLLRTRISNLLESREKIKSIFSAPTYKKAILENSLNELDNEFIERITHIIEENLETEELSNAFLAERLNMSSPTFFRKMKSLTGMAGGEFVRKIRLQHGEAMMLSGKYTLSEIAFKIGFSGLSSFRKAFKAEFNVSPSEYLKKLENGTSG